MPAKKTDADYLDDYREIVRKKDAEIADLKRTVTNIRRDNDTAEKIREELYSLSAHQLEIPEWISGRAVRNGARGGPITIWSDFHASEVVSKAETGGVNEFNSAICTKRFHRLVDTTIDLCFHHMGRANVAYPGIVVCLGGDMISGDIHEELAQTNDRTPHQCVHDMVDLLGGGLDRMATKFGRVFVPCVVGNHGRGTKKPRFKQRVFTSFDWSIYCSLARDFRKDKHIRFYIPDEADARFTMYGHRYLLTHGDSLGVKGGDGLIGAIGPIMRGTLKLNRQESQIGRDFDTCVMGHWHQYLTLPGLIVNNALKGYDEFAHLALRAPYSRPSQALWFTHPEHGITAHWQVYLEGRKHFEKMDNEWIKWTTT